MIRWRSWSFLDIVGEQTPLDAFDAFREVANLRGAFLKAFE